MKKVCLTNAKFAFQMYQGICQKHIKEKTEEEKNIFNDITQKCSVGRSTWICCSESLRSDYRQKLPPFGD